MYPHERSLVEEMKDKPFVLVGVNSDQTVEQANKAVAENKLNWRNFQNKSNGGEISKDWAVRGWPTVVILDEEMTIRFRGHDFKAARKIVAELLAGMTAGGK